jgi:hypothetical protein
MSPSRTAVESVLAPYSGALLAKPALSRKAYWLTSGSSHAAFDLRRLTSGLKIVTTLSH